MRSSLLVVQSAPGIKNDWRMPLEREAVIDRGLIEVQVSQLFGVFVKVSA